MKMEILAPAGNFGVLKAAVGAGADAVYFGLSELNARRGAENIGPEILNDVVAYAHAMKCKAYLALNVDLAQRELGLAIRYLELASRSSVDAVIVKDPAIFKMIPFFPELKFHLSTQAAISSSAGVRAAKEFGFSRVVLPRELDCEEVKSASSVAGIETEIFVQGALCFSISGRCMLSSWIGGRSGNRGLCASPCRFNWDSEIPNSRILSANDISLVKRLGKICEAGVTALKIEGRLKNADWVANAVRLYRKAMDATVESISEDEINGLGGYSGRKMTRSYFDGLRHDLTGDFGRPKGQSHDEIPRIQELERRKEFNISLKKNGDNLECMLNCDGREKEIMLNSSRKTEKNRTLNEFREEVSKKKFQDFNLGTIGLFPEDVLIPNYICRRIIEELSAFLHKISRQSATYVKIQLSEKLKDLLNNAREGNAENRKTLGEPTDRVRLASFKEFCEFRRKYPAVDVILENITEEDMEKMEGMNGVKPIVSLPYVIYEGGLEKIGMEIESCRKHGLVVEVNSWDGWYLASKAGAVMEAGPGLMVLNSLAAKFINEKACNLVTVSLEADHDKISDLSIASPVSLSLYVYCRPPLMFTRIRFDDKVSVDGFAIKEKKGMVFRFKNENENGVISIRPELCCDISNELCGDIKVRHLIADLTMEKSPVLSFDRLGKGDGQTHKFNFRGKLG